MSDSVGKISLDLELQSDLGKQINEAASKIGDQLQASLNKIDFKGLADTIGKTVKNSIESTMGAIQSSIEKTIESAIAGAISSSKGVKVPVDFATPTNAPMPNISPAVSPAQPRAPPIPKVNTGVNLDVVKAQIDNLSKSLDITNAQIENQQEKLLRLRDAYNNTFNQDRKNKLEEQILKTEATINKLTATSDKTGFKLADLDKQFEILSNSAKNATAGVEAFSNGAKKAGSSSDKLNSKVKGTGSAINKETSILGRAASGVGNSFNNMGNLISRSFNRVFRQIFIIGVIYKAMRGLIDYTGSALMTNAQFVNSLNQIRTNLAVAFMPIYQAILPALNALMSGLATVTAYIAAFINAIFGKTYQQSFQAAKGLNQAKAAMGAYGKSAKKTAKDVKEAQGSLMGFDEINTLSMSKNAGAGDLGGGGGVQMPPMVAPSIDLSPTSKAMKNITAIIDKIKAVFDGLKTFLIANKDVIISTVGGILAALGSFAIISNWTKIVGAFNLAIQGIGAAFAGISWPIVGVSLLIGLLVGNIIYLWRTNEDFRNSVLEIWQQIKDFITTVVNDMWTIVKEIWDKYGADLINNVKEFMKTIQDLIQNVWENFLKPFITYALEMLTWLWDKHLKGLVKEVGEFIMKLINGALELWNKFFAPIIGWLVEILGPIFAAVWAKIVDNFGTKVAAIADIAKGLIKALGGIIDFIVGVFTGNWSKAWEGIVNIFTGIFDALVGAAKYPLNRIIDMINAVIRGFNKISLPDWVPGIGGKGINISTIPKLAKGGVINQPTLAMVGEAGKEAVMPLENNTGWISDLAGQINAQGSNSEVVRLLQAILDILKNLGIDIKIDGEKFGRMSIKHINGVQRNAGKTLLII